MTEIQRTEYFSRTITWRWELPDSGPSPFPDLDHYGRMVRPYCIEMTHTNDRNERSIIVYAYLVKSNGETGVRKEKVHFYRFADIPQAIADLIGLEHLAHITVTPATEVVTAAEVKRRSED